MSVRPYPYAARAIVTHEIKAGFTYVWAVFRHPMDQTVTPPLAKWIVTADGVPKVVVFAAWLDFWTIQMIAVATPATIAQLYLEYDGPDTSLITTWGKQWEPWGPILSTDAILASFGSFFGNEINWQQAAAQNVWYTISDANITEGEVWQTVFQNNQEIKVSRAKPYLVTYYVSVECSIAGKHVLTAPEINGTEQPPGQTHHEFGRANEEESWAASAIFDLSVNDLVSVGIATDDPGNPNLTVNHIGLTVTELPEI